METDSAASPTSSTQFSRFSSGELDTLDDDEALVDYLLREGLTPANVPVCRSTLPCIVAYLKNSRSPDTTFVDIRSPSASAVEDTAALGAADDRGTEFNRRNSLVTSWQTERRTNAASQRLARGNQPGQSSAAVVVNRVVVQSLSTVLFAGSNSDGESLLEPDGYSDVFVGDVDPLLADWSSPLLTPKSNQSSTKLPAANETCPPSYSGFERAYKRSGFATQVRRHDGDRPFQCSAPDCSWRFSRSDELVRHQRSHSGVRPYPCRTCSKRFVRSDHLAKHQNVHRKPRLL